MRVPFLRAAQQVFARLPARRRLSLWMVLAAVAAFSLAAVFFSLPAIGVIEWRLADQWAAGRYGQTTSDDVAVIGIDEALFEEFEWPLDKDVYGELILFLQEAGAEVIAFDILFSDKLYACGKGDSIFRGTIQWFPNIVLGFGAEALRAEDANVTTNGSLIPERFAVGRGTLPDYSVRRAVLPYRELLECTHHIGSVNLAFPFPDGIDRTIPLFIESDSLLYPSLGLAAASLHPDGGEPVWDQANREIRVGKHNLRVDRNGHAYLHFSSVIPFYPMSEVNKAHVRMLSGKEPAIGRNDFEGRIVFVGNSAPSLGDLGTTPVSKKESGGRSPTVMLHARTAATILDDTAIRYHGRGAALLLSALLTLAFALLFRFVPMQYSFLAAFLAMGGMLFVSRQLYVNGDFVPMLEAMISGGIFVAFASFGIYLEKDADRRFLYATFGKYVSPALIENMARDNIKPELGGEEVYGTAFFSDIESFSRLSEGMSPMDLITNLNEYFSTMTHVLIDNNGTLDKYIGDAIVAFFGAPRPSHHHAREACTAAVRMQEALARLREKWRSHTSKPEEVRNLKMRIGINSGHFVTGNMGCDLRMNYTMLGDTVNLASRLEGVGKEYGIYTVIGEDTYRVVKHDFLLRKVDTIRVKGRKEPGGIYQLMGMPREGDGPLRELIGTYQEALEVYRRGDFAEAKKLFEESLRLERFADAKNPSQVMIERTKKLIAIEPKEWDGVYTMQHK